MIAVFFLGILFSFIGYTPPSVLNMTALKISLQGNKREFTQFTFGAVFIIFIQVYVSIYLTEYISENPNFLAVLEKFGIVVLFVLSLYFYKQNVKDKKQTVRKKSTNSFITGAVLSILNMFAIPFFSGIVVLLMSFNLISFDTSTIFLFVFGSVIGAFLILFLYGKYASKIQQKTSRITSSINLFLCYVTAFFGCITLFKFVL